MSAERIALVCPKCNKQLRAPMTAAGKIGKCNGCGVQVKIPHARRQPVARPSGRAAAPAMANADLQPTELIGSCSSQDFGDALQALIDSGQQQAAVNFSNRLSVEEVRNSVTQRLPKRPVSLAYRVHLLLVAGAMAALPLFYMMFVIAAGASVVWYITVLMPSLMAHTPLGRATFIYVAAVVSPALAGSILVVFLFKPLIFRIQEDQRRRSLTRQSQPLLFELVDRICWATGAPIPQRVDVDYRVNASAQPLGGVWSVAAGKMVLTIGLPLFAGLSSRQLAGVIAHEFGHFSQKIGMGASLVIRRVNFWFMRVVYQRDALDAALDSLIANSDWRLGMILQLASLGVMFSRGVMWCFMMLGHAISAGLMRQMEFDADRYAYGLVGSRTFTETALELQFIGIAQASAQALMEQFAHQGRLADDMILFGDHFYRQLTPEIRESVATAQAQEKSNWLDTHPTGKARIARANAASAEGAFNLDRPARELVRYYDDICRGVTCDFYRDVMETHITPQELTPTSQLLRDNSRD